MMGAAGVSVELFALGVRTGALLLSSAGVADASGEDVAWLTGALCAESLEAFPKSAPVARSAPLTSTAIAGRSLLTLFTCAEGALPSISSNHSGFSGVGFGVTFGVIGDSFQ
jgi:hypothetical protein